MQKMKYLIMTFVVFSFMSYVHADDVITEDSQTETVQAGLKSFSIYDCYKRNGEIECAENVKNEIVYFKPAGIVVSNILNTAVYLTNKVGESHEND